MSTTQTSAKRLREITDSICFRHPDSARDLRRIADEIEQRDNLLVECLFALRSAHAHYGGGIAVEYAQGVDAEVHNCLRAILAARGLGSDKTAGAADATDEVAAPDGEKAEAPASERPVVNDPRAVEAVITAAEAVERAAEVVETFPDGDDVTARCTAEAFDRGVFRGRLEVSEERDKAESERDELLRLLQCGIDVLSRSVTSTTEAAWITKARAAIERHKKGGA